MPRILYFFIFSLVIVLQGCHPSPFRDYPQGVLLTARNEKITTIVADTSERQVQGLSGLQNTDWKEDWAMLFIYPDEGVRKFWMPDTYFALDIFFLGADLKVIHVERNVPPHPGKQEPPEIARTPPIFAQHVLELKADSSLSKSIVEGEKLTWQGPNLLPQTSPDTHLQK